MKLEILGSGGAVTTPRPFCKCESCKQAKEKGTLYSRLGPSVFIHGPNILIDTPEEIFIEINRSRIDEIQACFYSHWHPDHTSGRRIFEMNIDWTGYPQKNKKTKVLLTEKIASTFESCMSLMDHFKFFDKQGIVDIQIIKNDEDVEINGYSVKPIQLGNEYVFGYMVTGGLKTILVVMDELKNWKPDEFIKSIQFDLVYLPFGVFDVNPITNIRLIDERHPILKEEQTINETIEVIRNMNSKRFILSHIEEPDNITFDLARELSKYYSQETKKRIDIAYDTMVIDV